MKDLSSLWIWLVIFLLLFFCVPYLFVGAYEPLVFGMPLWFLSVLAASFGLTGFTLYIILYRWRLAAIILGEKED
jgi:hypothetical protein